MRPDGLVIATDNLVEEALGALHGAGIVIGRDIDVVAHRYDRAESDTGQGSRYK